MQWLRHAQLRSRPAKSASTTVEVEDAVTAYLDANGATGVFITTTARLLARTASKSRGENGRIIVEAAAHVAAQHGRAEPVLKTTTARSHG